MKRIFPDFAYGDGPRTGCWWDETIAAPDWPVLQDSLRVDVAVIGAGFTGVSAALHLAEAGSSVAVLEAETPGWGASGRNGGFCCLGGAKISEKALVETYGAAAARSYRQAERDAVNLVADLLARHRIQADRHSQGETQLAHRLRDMDRLRRAADGIVRGSDPEPILIEKEDLARNGMNGPFFGALTTPVGFALNPRKYLFGLARAARSKGAAFFQKSAAARIEKSDGGNRVHTEKGQIVAQTVLIATNGYSSEDMPDWLAGRYIPSQSNVLVTRPLTDTEIADQGWSTAQMAYDTRNLLHYFRLMPDRRFLFGMRGGLHASPASERGSRERTRKDFERMFPAWRHVPSANQWSGMVCLSRRLVPFAGPIPGRPGMFAGLAYHGNGVAMGSYAGKMLADLALSRSTDVALPAVLSAPMARFPLGSARRLVMPFAYLYYGLLDR
ncbi:FAD-dependent oxidoreductase [Sedimentitalea sp. JM2-8]|uniref:FAD-dependent oxidoreductase n=1 Tax=Sedimentitalea xiamensis TaxID=3050037 RepID=A0ABT7F934_9RHOB|nr:FAD-dependent oxidoreductase [Sedimentitalea xiamensis]MDK3071617.1 FAD-dependent oxidoreductase [Sedimentitalea xiamensis]